MGSQTETVHAEPARRHILLAVDDTEASERARDWIVDNMLRAGDEVHFLHVVAPGETEVVGGYGGAGVDELIAADPNPEVENRRVQEARDFIQDHFVPKVKQAGGTCKVEIARAQSNAENVGKVLCHRAKELQVAALVMASHNKGAVRRFFLGSANQYCTQHCTQPLVVLH